jgi:hypothetical protein
MSLANVPRVFVSHASEDKARFVLSFAEDLRAAGVDAWVDRWEMLPGDSLVRKIFSEGIENAQAVIVVLSRISVTKPWVMEELDAAVVKRINEKSKLIPIVLDGLDVRSEVPTSVRHLLLEYVADPSGRRTVVDRVVRSIFGEVERPPLGPPPLFAGAMAVRIPGLDRIDSLVFRIIGDATLETGSANFDTVQFIADATDELAITDDQVIESLEVLEGEQYIRISRTLGGELRGMKRFEITTYGLEIYLRAYDTRYPLFEQSILARLAAQTSRQGTEKELAESGDVPRLVVRHVLDVLASNNQLKLSKTLGGSEGWRYYNVSPRLRRRASP